MGSRAAEDCENEIAALKLGLGRHGSLPHNKMSCFTSTEQRPTSKGIHSHDSLMTSHCVGERAAVVLQGFSHYFRHRHNYTTTQTAPERQMEPAQLIIRFIANKISKHIHIKPEHHRAPDQKHKDDCSLPVSFRLAELQRYSVTQRISHRIHKLRLVVSLPHQLPILPSVTNSRERQICPPNIRENPIPAPIPYRKKRRTDGNPRTLTS